MQTERASSVDDGTDAPGVIRGLRAVGVVGIVLATLAGLGISMIFYARVGKYRVRERTLSGITWRGDEVVLDIGTGRSFLAAAVARQVPQGRVVGVGIWRAEDLTANTIANAEHNLRREGVADRVELLDHDASALPFQDATFDVILSLLCIHNIEPTEKKVEACREIVRVLKTAEYASIFRERGRVVEGPDSCVGTALGLMGTMRATKLVP